ncbi:hypothetical protein MKW92_018635 [Papaver armeniacum]|nr:hypothetical protein MKW92_018635 [Papaver armeniacum]
MSANITLRAPPRSKKSSKKAGRINSSVDKGKVKRRRKSVLRKEKQAKKPTKTKPRMRKRKINSNVEEVIYSDSDVEEATIFGSIPPSALEVDKNGVSASLLGRLTLQQESTSSLTYYCPQLLVEVYHFALLFVVQQVHFAMNLIFANRDLLRTHFVCYFVDICAFF